jgi:hypothetical protein
MNPGYGAKNTIHWENDRLPARIAAGGLRMVLNFDVKHGILLIDVANRDRGVAPRRSADGAYG